ncbi:hypothetical protein JKI95_01830 [Corynebacterium aquatimens]|uniref:hypothetical protein n=1 Tax=Corynebacterium TaxID=1716 RepID=UPI001F3B06D6|nr:MULTISPECIES: hypothetical protein [Corynebacterium]QYH19876.1 hypothetical protein JKI95_01830 [Corynebacterium aquatimens]UIZ92966.1 hypothetical protein JZY91_04305 [Corynebacterium sp. CNCTC7651]
MTNPEQDSTTPDLTVRDTAEFEDHRLPLQRALKFGGWALVVLTVLSLMGWGAARDLPGIWGVLMGVGIGGGFVLATALTVLATSNSSPTATMAVVLGGWLVKMVILVLLLLWLKQYSFYDGTAFGVTTIAALVVALAAETWGVITSRTAYIGS